MRIFLPIWYFFKVPFYYFGTRLTRLLGLKGLAPRWYYAGDGLLYGKSYRLPPIGYFHLMRRIAYFFLQVWKNKAPFTLEETGASDLAMFDTNQTTYAQRQEYLQRLTGEKASLLIPFDIPDWSYDPWHAFWLSLMVVLLLPFIALFALIPSLRTKVGLWPRELAFAFNSLMTLRVNRRKRLHFFSIYERDCNFLALLLLDSGIEVNKITSEVPLTFFKQVIISGTISLCFKYQEEELPAYRKTMFADKIQMWVPEQSFFHLDRYLHKDLQTPDNVVALYTSGGWRRRERGDANVDLGYHESEEKLYEHLAAYLQDRPGVQLLLFLHPIEKDSSERFLQAQGMYGDLFGKDRIAFADPEVRTSLAFEQADLAVAVFSAVLYDRIFCGFKSVFAPLYIKGFPMKDTGLARISAMSQEELYDLMDKGLSLSKDEFFTAYGLEGYRAEEQAIFSKS